MTGSFPGGPSADGDDLSDRHLRRGEEAEAELDANRLRGRRARRRRAWVVAVGVSVTVATGAGMWVGFRGESGPASDARVDDGEVDILVRERRRILAELWRMEEAEVLRGRR